MNEVCFTRELRIRECGALHIPCTIEAEVFKFDLLDCDCEIQYDAELFSTFSKVRAMYDDVLGDSWVVPMRRVKETLYKPYKMIF
jgi:hypothetical protein